MTIETSGPVVVGTDGSEPAAMAVALAAWEAGRRGTTLRLLHAHLPALPYGALGFAPFPPELPDPLEPAHQLLAEVTATLHERHPELAIESVIVPTSAPAALVEASREASLVVVGTRGLGGFAGLVLGSVSAQLAAHAHAPVIVARPAADHAAGIGPAGLPVVVGVDGTPEGRAALGFAFDEAAARGVPLIALYAWWMLPPGNLGPTRPGHYDLVEAEEEARRMLAEAVAGWCEEYPDVRVDLVPGHHLNPAIALLEAGERAGLIVVSRHGGNLLTRTLLASTGDMVLREAQCPVAVVPPQPQP